MFGGGAVVHFVFHGSLLKSFVGHLWRINESIRLVKVRLHRRKRHCGGFRCLKMGGFDLSMFLCYNLGYFRVPPNPNEAKHGHMLIFSL